MSTTPASDTITVKGRAVFLDQNIYGEWFVVQQGTMRVVLDKGGEWVTLPLDPPDLDARRHSHATPSEALAFLSTHRDKPEPSPPEAAVGELPDELDTERKQVERDHLCDCDTCQRSGAICPASAGTLIDELAQLRIARRKAAAPAHAELANAKANSEANWQLYMDMHGKWEHAKRELEEGLALNNQMKALLDTACDQRDATESALTATTAELARVRSAIDDVRSKADNAYCSGIQKARSTDCLGWAAKMRAGEFGKEQMDAHTECSRLFGEHKGLADAANIIAAALAKGAGQ